MLRVGVTVAALALTACASHSPLFSHAIAAGAAVYNPQNVPDIEDWGSVKITLSRGACLGACPVYEVAITGDGTVTYCGVQFVAAVGLRTRTISQENLRALLAKFTEAGFFQLEDSYVGGVTDMPWYRTSVAFDGRKKQVADYVGASVGMPLSVIELEMMIDAQAGTTAWVGDIKDFGSQNRVPDCEGKIAPPF